MRATRAQVAHSDVRLKVSEASTRHGRQLEAQKKQRQTAIERLTAETITGEASEMVEELIRKATCACSAASSILNVTTETQTASSSSLQAGQGLHPFKPMVKVFIAVAFSVPAPLRTVCTVCTVCTASHRFAPLRTALN